MSVAETVMRSKARTIGHTWRTHARTFREAGLATPDLDARLLAAAAFGLPGGELLSGAQAPAPPGQTAQLTVSVSRRLAGEPVSRILGERAFWKDTFTLSPATLDPRPESETLVEAAVAVARAISSEVERPLRILDLGTGTGCLLLSILRELPGATGIGTDIAPGAIATAQTNAERLNLADRAAFIETSWCEGVADAFDIIVSNPPYICEASIADLAIEVRRYDPLSALDGGTDGLAAYRAIAEAIKTRARPAALVLEVGAGQSQDVAALFSFPSSAGPVQIHEATDLAGIVRCLTFT